MPCAWMLTRFAGLAGLARFHVLTHVAFARIARISNCQAGYLSLKPQLTPLASGSLGNGRPVELVSCRTHCYPSVISDRPLEAFSYSKRCYSSVSLMCARGSDRPLEVYSYSTRSYPSVISDRSLKVFSYRKRCYCGAPGHLSEPS